MSIFIAGLIVASSEVIEHGRQAALGRVDLDELAGVVVGVAGATGVGVDQHVAAVGAVVEVADALAGGLDDGRRAALGVIDGGGTARGVDHGHAAAGAVVAEVVGQ